MENEEITKEIIRVMNVAASLRDRSDSDEFYFYHAGGFQYLLELLKFIDKKNSEL